MYRRRKTQRLLLLSLLLYRNGRRGRECACVCRDRDRGTGIHYLRRHNIDNAR